MVFISVIYNVFNRANIIFFNFIARGTWPSAVGIKSGITDKISTSIDAKILRRVYH
jgi:hypothetical protein